MQTRLEQDTGLEFRYILTSNDYEKLAMLRPLKTYKWLEKKLKKDVKRGKIYAS